LNQFINVDRVRLSAAMLTTLQPLGRPRDREKAIFNTLKRFQVNGKMTGGQGTFLWRFFANVGFSTEKVFAHESSQRTVKKLFKL